MAKLVEIKNKTKKPKEEWTITISGETWQSPVSETYTVGADRMQPDSRHFKGLILVQALYKYGLMDDSNIDNVLADLPQGLVDTFGIELNLEGDDLYNALQDFVSGWLPGYDNGYGWDYPYETIDIQIKNNDGRKFKINYTKKDVIDALKAFEIAI